MKKVLISGAVMLLTGFMAFSACGKDSTKAKDKSESSAGEVSGGSSSENTNPVAPESSSESSAEPEIINVIENPAVFLGIKDYASMNKDGKNDFKYRFFINGEEKIFVVGLDEEYKIQNSLKEGYLYSLGLNGETISSVKEITSDMGPTDGVLSGYYETVSMRTTELSKIYTVNRAAGGSTVKEGMISDNVYCMGILNEDGSVKEAYIVPSPSWYDPQIKGTAGEKTLTNLIKTAVMPAGCVNYVYGGGWDWQDVASSSQAKSIGVADSWTDFFFSQDGNYKYKPDYYPNGGWNEYYYAGLDCSGYVGWVIYNVMNTADGAEGYVMSSTKMAGNFAERGWGTATTSFKAADFKPGDIFSMKGHVWMCIGTCSDGSIVIAHSTPSKSRIGNDGGGVQLSAIGDSKNCEAYQLADKYMSQFCPEWYARYEVALKSYADYTALSGAGTGKFTWKLDGGVLSDPDGIFNMSAADVLKTIYGC